MMYFIMTPFCDTINFIGSLNGNKNLRLNFNDFKNGTTIEIEKGFQKIDIIFSSNFVIYQHNRRSISPI